MCGLSKRVPLEIVHDAAPGRVRFRHRGLVARQALAQKTETALRKTIGVTSAMASPLTGSILVTYAAPGSRDRLTEIIDAVIARTLPEVRA
jgi:Ca2+-transporting ATPase